MRHEDLIQKYFSKELSDTERLQFDELLKTNTEFQEEFALQKDIKKAITDTERKRKKVLLKSYENQINDTRTRTSGFNRKIIAIAASILIIGGLGWYMSFLMSTDLEQLYAEHYEVYPNTVYSISRSDTIQTLQGKAFFAYESENYKEAILLFKELKETNEVTNIDFYLGQSYLKEGQIENATQTFKIVLNRDQDFKEESEWYLVLSYLKLKNTSNAILQLQKIIANNTYKKEEASLLLQKLD